MKYLAFGLQFTVAITLTAGVTYGQQIRVTPRTVIAEGTATRSFREPHLAINPQNGRHLVVATIVPAAGDTFNERVSRQICAAFTSFDSGVTWSRHDFDVAWCFDPWAVITPDNQVLVTVLAEHVGFPQQGRGGLLAFHSPDGGRTWDQAPLGLGTPHDHSTMAVDLSTTPRRGFIYILSGHPVRDADGERRWTIFVARSRDGGKTFDEPVNIMPNNLHNFAEMPVVLRDGTFVASFVDASHRTDKPNGNANDQNFERRRAWIVRSTDAGQTFSTPMFVNDACGPPPGFRLSALAADTSDGPFSGRLYFACRQAGGGRIVVSRAVDGREQWPAPVALGDESTIAEERIPGLAVNNRGVLVTAWIDGRTVAGHHCEEAVYVASSLDGGASFSPVQRISTTDACADTVRIDSTGGGVDPTGGDYFGLAAAPDGIFRIVWVETRNGVSQLSIASLDVPGAEAGR
jgi:hypothetical protein